MRRLFPLLAVLALAACKNDCQKICDEMADFAEECGTPWEREDLKTCRADMANRNKSKEQRDACEDALPGLRDEWTCEDLEPYHSGDDDDDDGGDDGGGTGGSDSGAR
jgi:hypothetical protein